MKHYKTDNTTAVLRFREEPMKKHTVDLIIKIGIELVDIISIYLKEKLKRKKKINTAKI